MAKMGKFSANDLKKLQKQLNQIKPNDIDAFIEQCAKELAARLLAKVIPRTPVGVYGKSFVKDNEGNKIRYKAGKNKGKIKRAAVKTGGTLRRGWTSKSHEEAAGGSGKGSAANAKAYVDSLKVNYFGNPFVVEIKNPVEYASYVEFGHRTANHKGIVEGKHMLEISENEIQNIAPNVLEAKVKKFLGECFK